MSDLSERLVDVANEAMFENLPKPQRAIVVALLRLLADEGDYVEFALNPQGYIRELADEIEEKQ